jgi:hypothetical protein
MLGHDMGPCVHEYLQTPLMGHRIPGDRVMMRGDDEKPHSSFAQYVRGSRQRIRLRTLDVHQQEIDAPEPEVLEKARDRYNGKVALDTVALTNQRGPSAVLVPQGSLYESPF